MNVAHFEHAVARYKQRYKSPVCSTSHIPKGYAIRYKPLEIAQTLNNYNELRAKFTTTFGDPVAGLPSATKPPQIDS